MAVTLDYLVVEDAPPAAVITLDRPEQLHRHALRAHSDAANGRVQVIRRRRRHRRLGFIGRRLANTAREGGYIAVVTVILCPLLFGVSAFTIDV